MSRTDKDRPWWLSEWYEPSHHSCIYDMRYRIWYRACDLPQEPVRGQSKPAVWRRRHGRAISCSWEPIPDEDQHISRYNWRPTRKERHDDWWHPDRARVRDWCTEARKEYWGEGDLHDDLAPVTGPRHGSIAGWW